MSERFPRLPWLGLLVLLAGCDQPPTKEIAAAEKQVQIAREAGAEQFAPDRWHEAQTALENARREMQVKDYRGALGSANEASERARSAVQAVNAARANARARAEVAHAETQASLDRVAAVRLEAEAAKVPAAAFEEWEPRVEQVRAKLAEVAGALERGELLEAAQLATTLKEEAATLPERYREARQRWEEEHPKARGRGPKARKGR